MQRQIRGQSVADKGGHSPVAIHNNNSSTSKSRAFNTRRSAESRGFKSRAYHIGLRVGSFTVRGQSLHYDISKALVL